MKLEVGMYVRTKKGFIDKIILVDYAEEKKQNYPNHPSKNHWRDKILLSKKGYWQTTQNIIKFSYNIIDLIEVGDLLTIEYYSERYSKRVTRIFEVTYKDEEYINLDNAKCQFLIINKEWSNGDKNLKPVIKSIVTKEQFKEIEYEVK